MIRRIIEIDSEKCNGCGACARACHEGAIAIVDGKARLMRDDYCDGLGDCLPACPTDAIHFVEREAAAYDEAAVMAAKAAKDAPHSPCAAGGCPGSAARELCSEDARSPVLPAQSRLRTWPVQIRLAPVNAPFFKYAKLLIAADCCAYAYGNFHEEFIKDHVCLIGCPKLDSVDYSEKLTEIFKSNDIRSVTVTRMQVPCCGGLELAVKKALLSCGKLIPWSVVTIASDGSIVDKT